MTKLIAYLSLAAATMFVHLGNFWFTYGIWPRSWTAFWLFVVASLAVQSLFRAVEAEKK